MPALTVNIDAQNTSSRSSSPTRPPISPITPPLAATQLPDSNSASHPNLSSTTNTTATATQQQPSSSLPPRQTFTHPSHPDQAASIPAPAPEPIAFDSNPDVIALRSAISVLQVQRKRAAADVQALSKAMDGAVADPAAFIEDLAAGKVKTQGDAARAAGSFTMGGGKESDDEDEDEEDGKRAEGAKPWTSLPGAQNVVRTPPINWNQYAIVGESLDKLHAEQVSRPSQGAPASFSGTYEFRGTGKQEQYPGIAAPFNPVKDRLDRQPSSRGRRS